MKFKLIKVNILLMSSLLLGTTLLSGTNVLAEEFNLDDTELTSSQFKSENEKIVSEYFGDPLSRAANTIPYSVVISKAYPLAGHERVRWTVQYVKGKKYQGWITNSAKDYTNLRVVDNRLYMADFTFRGTLTLVK